MHWCDFMIGLARKDHIFNQNRDSARIDRIGVFFTFFGVIIFFDKGVMAMANITTSYFSSQFS